jgi:hypothetical protein
MDLQKLTYSTYVCFIQNIIATRGQWSPPTDYWEGHHIIPKCLGGLGHTKQKHPNIIRLTAAEHFTAHKLLAELFPNNSKLTYAFWAMCTVSKSAPIATAEEYQAAREARSRTIGSVVQTKLIGLAADDQVRSNHSQKQSGELNGFFGKTHSDLSRAKLAEATSKAVRHLNTGVIYKSSYEAATALGINRVLINNCCRGKQASTMGGMMFEYVNPQDINRGVPGKNSLTKYERRREIIELRTLIVGLNKTFPGILATEDTQRIRKLATCENKRYLLDLLTTFMACTYEKAFEEYLNDFGLSEQLRTTINGTIRDL